MGARITWAMTEVWEWWDTPVVDTAMGWAVLFLWRFIAPSWGEIQLCHLAVATWLVLTNDMQVEMTWITSFCTESWPLRSAQRSPWGFPGGTSGKKPACQCRRHRRPEFNSWVRNIPWRRAWQPTPGFLPGKSHGRRSLVGCSPWGHRVGHNWST